MTSDGTDALKAARLERRQHGHFSPATTALRPGAHRPIELSQRIQWAQRPKAAPVQHVGINHGRGHVRMAQLQLMGGPSSVPLPFFIPVRTSAAGAAQPGSSDLSSSIDLAGPTSAAIAYK